MKLKIMRSYSSKDCEIDLKTGVINGYRNWIFLGLHHVKKNEFIPLSQLTPEKIKQMKEDGTMFYKNRKCQWNGVDLDHGTKRWWASPKILSIWTE